jgi:hypothetical protein
MDYLKIECLMGLFNPTPISYGVRINELDKLDSILTRKSNINQNHSFKFFIMVLDKDMGRKPISVTEEEARKFISGNL